MKNMSFMLTIEQIKNRTKTVTRRLGWDSLKVGDVLQAVEKCKGLKKGEKLVKLGVIKITDITPMPLNEIWPEDCFAEGFPDMSPRQFIDMFCKEMRCSENTNVNRIEFEYYDGAVL